MTEGRYTEINIAMDNEQLTPPNTPKEPSFWEKSHQIICFFTAIVICCGIYVFAICRQNHYMIERQDKIIKTFETHSQEKSNTIIVPYSPNFNPKTLENEKVYDEVRSLLELEFNKIQNEFEALEIWAGVLTVIFLIFSFYSFFKTEQMEQQSKEALRLINGTQTKSDDLLKKMEKEKNDKINSIENSFKDWSEIKGNSIKKLLDKKSMAYQKQLSHNYMVEYEKKVAEIEELFNTKTIDFISNADQKFGEELQKFIDGWESKMEQIRADYKKRQREVFSEESFATKEDIENLFKDEPEDEVIDDNEKQ